MEKFMLMALDEAKKAYENKEVPVGCVIVKDNQVIVKAHNEVIKNKNSNDHAEIVALKKASALLSSTHLNNLEIYVTLEPCIMCIGAILNANIKKLVFGAYDTKEGFISSKIDLTPLLKNKPLEIYGGIMEDECSLLIKSFFKEIRINKEYKLK